MRDFTFAITSFVLYVPVCFSLFLSFFGEGGGGD